MYDNSNNLGKILVILGSLILVGGGTYFFMTRNKTFVSPLPSENTVKVIFITQTPTAEPSLSSTPSATPRILKRRSTPTPSASASATPKVSPTVKPTVKLSPTGE